jgi:hypothetical protein
MIAGRSFGLVFKISRGSRMLLRINHEGPSINFDLNILSVFICTSIADSNGVKGNMKNNMESLRKL